MNDFEEKITEELHEEPAETAANEDDAEPAELPTLPCIPLRGLTIFPQTIMHFDIGREKSIKALEYAMKHGKELFVTSQMDENILIPTPDDYYKVGTVIKVKQMLKIQGDSIRVLVDGQYRAVMKELVSEEPFLVVRVEEAEIIPASSEDPEVTALKRAALDNFDEYLGFDTGLKDSAYDVVASIDDPGLFADTMTMQLLIKIPKKQEVLEAFDVKERLTVLNRILVGENHILGLEKAINDKVQESIKNNQKEYYLREQMKAIQEELGTDEDAEAEADKWLKRLEELVSNGHAVLGGSNR